MQFAPDCPWCEVAIDNLADHVVTLQSAKKPKPKPARREKPKPKSTPKPSPVPAAEVAAADFSFIEAPEPEPAPPEPEPDPVPVATPTPFVPAPRALAAPPAQVLPKPRPFRPTIVAIVEDEQQQIELPEPPSAAADPAPLQHRKSHLPKLLSREDFDREQAKLDTQTGPRWEDETRPEKKLGEEERVRVLRPKDDGLGMEWVTVPREQLFGRTSRWINRSALYALCTCAAIVVISFAAKLAHAGIGAMGAGEEADDPGKLPARHLPALLSKDDTQAADDLVRAFCAAPERAARLEFVRYPERARRLAAGRPFAPIQIGDRLKVKQVTDDGRHFVVLAFESPESAGGYRFFAVEQTPDRGLRVDWEFAVGYQPMAIGDFQNSRPQQSVPFRVKAERGMRWSPAFDPESYAYYELTSPGRKFTLHAYVDRESPHATLLDSHTLGGGTASMVLDLRYPQMPVGEGAADEVEIAGIARAGWFYHAPN